MPKIRFSTEPIVTLLRQIEISMAQGKTVRKPAGVWGYLNGEFFCSLKEAQIVIEQWRKHFNTIRARSALNYRPPAPRRLAPSAHHLSEIMPTQ
jgi:transposase InsO family protein